ncbi:hypothetical protein NE237_023051 [Protea cynaroides]|uniref:Uncharacterized protein n=1 Tax=Protea cynaroides TaxID=273540 RepID=A0A9Q0HB04_9MAGN|nr:hypothetical protein NE237_023051 [Protea cynaroides]
MESSASLSLPKNTNSFPSEPSVIPFLHHKSSVDTIVTKPIAERTQLANGYVDAVSNAESVPSVQQSSQHSHVTVGLMPTPNLSSSPCVGPNIVLHPTVMPLASTGSQATHFGSVESIVGHVSPVPFNVSHANPVQSTNDHAHTVQFEGPVQSTNDHAHPVQFEGPIQSTNDHGHPVQFDDVNSGPFQSEFDSTDGDRSMPGPDQISTVITERIDDQISRAITERFDAPSSSVQPTEISTVITERIDDQISGAITERFDAPLSSVQPTDVSLQKELMLQQVQFIRVVQFHIQWSQGLNLVYESPTRNTF